MRHLEPDVAAGEGDANADFLLSERMNTYSETGAIRNRRVRRSTSRTVTVYRQAYDVKPNVCVGAEPKASEADGEGVRCYCNTAQCVATSYLCRAAHGGGCYSELPAPKRHHARHGCLYHLADTEEEAVSKCQNMPSDRPAAPARAHSLLLCCFRDLCNHEDSPIARARLNLTAPDEEVSRVGWARAGSGGEAWLRAATVAVPVCGALILLLLVAVAVRLLRADALLHAHHKLRGGYISPLSQHNGDDVKKVWIGNSPLLVAPGGCLVAVERAQLLDQPPPHKER